MASSLRPIIVVLLLGQGLLMWWMSGQYRPTTGSAGEKKEGPVVQPIWDAGEADRGKFWGNEGGKVIGREGVGIDGKGEAITIRFTGPGWRGCGFNWKGWYPPDDCDDVSKRRSLVFYVRQLTHVPDADLTIHLVDNVKRPTKEPASNGQSVLVDGCISRIDSEWRRVVLPLDRFARNKDLDLTRIWGIDFSSSSGRTIHFQVDRIGFSDDCPPRQKFSPTAGYVAEAKIDLDHPAHAIRDEIYGACELPPNKITEYGLPIARWGGNRTSRFNWKINADSAGKDWFFKNGGHKVGDPADGGWVRFLRTLGCAGATGYVTVPMIGYVAKDQKSYAFSVKKYGPQQSTEIGHQDVGNGLLANGRPIESNDWRDTSVEAGPEFIAEGIQLAVRHAGGTGPRYWALDNEPMLWHETHRDVRHQPLGANDLWERTVKYAEAIKQADPMAKVAGFCSWGWKDLYVAADGEAPRTDGGLPLAEWFIKKCGEYKREHGKSLVDVFDFHWYPEAKLAGRGPYLGTGMDVSFNELRLRTTRDLWDPKYTPESWIREMSGGEATMVLRRVRGWIEKHNPGMEVCVGEYNFGGGDNITGALAQADMFGILAREKADLAFIWTHPEGTQELAWKLFRNYDGAGGRFGDRYVRSESNHGDLAVYTAKRSMDGATTIAVVNKNLGGQCSLTLNVPGLKGQVRIYRFDQESGCDVLEVGKDADQVDGKITISVPAASGTMIVVK
jgi:hypothetical protein